MDHPHLSTDGSREAQLAASTALDLANATNSELHVVTVTGGRAYDMELQEVVEELQREAQKVLDEQVRKIEEAGGKVTQTHARVERRGRREQPIVELAEEIGAGLIVMGSRGLGGVRRALLGSVSESVVRHAHCPVMIGRPEKQRAA